MRISRSVSGWVAQGFAVSFNDHPETLREMMLRQILFTPNPHPCALFYSCC